VFLFDFRHGLLGAVPPFDLAVIDEAHEIFVEHRVRMKDFRRWLESQGKTPAECTRKRKLIALVKGEGQER
jgi:hypothetical protein